MEVPARTTPNVQAAWRLRVLAVPPPTIPRSLLLVLALLTAGVEVGLQVFVMTGGGREWMAQTYQCGNPAWAGLQWNVCMQAVQRRLARFELASVGVTAAAGLAVLTAVPAVVRRHHRLRPMGAGLTPARERVLQLANQAGLRRSPQVMTGPSTLKGAFCYGLPSRYRIVLPPALAVRAGTSAFDAVVRHEVAHLARHDVVIAWSARAVWYVLLPALAAPVVLSVVSGDTSGLPGYVWRAALLLLGGFIAAAGVLSAREFDADLSSTTSADQREALVQLLTRSTGHPHKGWRRLASLHPTPQDRAATIECPELLGRAHVLDAALSGFLAALAIPLLDYAIFPSAAMDLIGGASVPAVAMGGLLGATVGLSLARLALVERARGGATQIHVATSRTALALGVGYVLGQTASLGSAENSGAAPHSLSVTLAGIVMIAGATFVTAGVALLAASAAPRMTARTHTWAVIGMSGSLFAIALWGVESIGSSVDLEGWGDEARIALNVMVGRGVVPAAVSILALSVLALLRRRQEGGQAPHWLIEEGACPGWGPRSPGPGVRQTLLLAAAAGLVSEAVIVAFGLINGPSKDEAHYMQSMVTYLWAFGAAGAVTAVALLATYGMDALGAALLASPCAAALAAGGLVVVNNSTGGSWTWVDALKLILGAASVAVLLLLPLSALAFIPALGRAAPRRAFVAALVTVLLSGAVSGGAIAVRNTLSPLSHSDLTREKYLSDYLPWVRSELERTQQAVKTIAADHASSSTEKARRVRIEVSGPLRYLQASAAQLKIVDEGLRRAHADLVAGLDLMSSAYDKFARAFEYGDSTLSATAQAERSRAWERLLAWLDGLKTAPDWPVGLGIHIGAAFEPRVS